MGHIAITDWERRYEVNQKGSPAKPGESLRQNPLDYYRSKVFGRAHSEGWRLICALAKGRALEGFGLFHKLLEIAADEPRGLRGTIRGRNHEPASIEEIAFAIGVPIDRVRFCVGVLLEAGWIVEIDPASGNSRNSRRPHAHLWGLRENPEPSERNETRTKQNETERNETEASRKIREGGSDAALDSPSPRSSRLATVNFGCPGLRTILGPAMKGKADAKVVADIERQIGGLGPDRITEVERQAEKIMGGGGRNPLAVFVAAMKEQGYYRPRKAGDV